jgi:hypothetical protein
MANKLYILTIEYNEEEDQIEYIQEEIVNADELNKKVLINELQEKDYWDEDSLAVMKKFYSGEIGES